MKVILIMMSLLIVSCSSNKLLPEPSENVISRIDQLSSRPEWLKESEPFIIDNGKVISLGQTTIPGDNRVEAAYRISENNAKASISSAIEQRLDFVFQNAEEGTSIDATQAKYIGAEASKITTSALKLKNRYWEKVATTNENGKIALTFRVFASVEMNESDFKQAILEAIRKSQGKGGLSKDFAEKVNQHWDKFTKEQ